MNSANYEEIVNTTTTIGTNGGNSYYGTYDQCGNVYEWTEGVGPDIGIKDSIRKTRYGLGGRYVGRNAELGLRSDYAHYFAPEQSGPGIGFRICSHSYGNKQDRGILQPNPLANPLKFSTFVIIGDVGNEADTPVPITKDETIEFDQNRYGSVNYEYLIQKFPVSVEEYCQFLNSVAVESDPHKLWIINMMSSNHPIIKRENLNNKFLYYPLKNKDRKPVTFVNWYNAARFINWLSNGMPIGLQDNSTTEDGTYTLNNITTENNVNIIRNQINPNTNLAPSYWMSSHDEWYKAAYYKGGSKDAGYWTFATQSDCIPLRVTSDLLENGSASVPIPNHEHNICDIKNFSGIKGITIIEIGNTVLEFKDGILINYQVN